MDSNGWYAGSSGFVGTERWRIFFGCAPSMSLHRLWARMKSLPLRRIFPVMLWTMALD